MQVPAIRTVCTSYELCKSIIISWKKLFNSIPSKESVCIILAQHQVETGANSCWNWNLCNIKYVKINGNVDWVQLNNVFEIVNGKRVEIPPTNPGAWFRAFNTLNDGTEFYLQFVAGKRYKAAWDAVIAGNPSQFSHLLKVAGYYSADEKEYTAIIMAYFNKLIKLNDYENAIKELTPEVPVVPPQMPPEAPVVETPPVPPVPEEKAPEPPVAPFTDPKLNVPGWQGGVYTVLNDAPWVRLIEWIANLFRKP